MDDSRKAVTGLIILSGLAGFLIATGLRNKSPSAARTVEAVTMTIPAFIISVYAFGRS
jgi:hypothetical protein